MKRRAEILVGVLPRLALASFPDQCLEGFAPDECQVAVSNFIPMGEEAIDAIDGILLESLKYRQEWVRED